MGVRPLSGQGIGMAFESGAEPQLVGSKLASPVCAGAPAVAGGGGGTCFIRDSDAFARHWRARLGRAASDARREGCASAMPIHSAAAAPSLPQPPLSTGIGRIGHLEPPWPFEAGGRPLRSAESAWCVSHSSLVPIGTGASLLLGTASPGRRSGEGPELADVSTLAHDVLSTLASRFSVPHSESSTLEPELEPPGAAATPGLSALRIAAGVSSGASGKRPPRGTARGVTPLPIA